MNNLMNTLAKTLLAAGLLTANPILAKPTAPDKPAGFQAQVYPTKTNTIRVTVEKTQAQPLTITLRPKGQLAPLFSQYMTRKQSQLALHLDVTAVVEGDYEVEVKSASGTVVKHVHIGAPQPVVARERLVAIQ